MAIDYRTVIRDETERMVTIVRQTPNDSPVPGCPNWNLGQLACHMGEVQRWATHIVRNGEPARIGWDGEQAPADYLAAGAAPLIAAFDEVDLDAPTWTFLGIPQTNRFWLRRQALEVAAHRWDAQSATGNPEPIDSDIAVDSIDEFLRLMIARIIRRTGADLSPLVGDVHLHCTDADGEWTFDIHDGEVRVTSGHAKATTAVRGAASDLALFLFNRVGRERVEIFGDHKLLQGWQDILRF